MKQKYDIFISYRRKGGAQYARILQLMLSQRGYKVFLDYDELKDGKFNEHIQEAIRNAPIFMLVLSEGALQRCKDEKDWLRREIQLAIAEGKHIIPINPDKSFDGIPDDIPEDIREEVGMHQHSEISFGQTLGVTVDFMVKTRIEPQIGKRTPPNKDIINDIDILNKNLQEEDKAKRLHRLFIKSAVVLGVLIVVALVGWIGFKVLRINQEEHVRKNLIEQIEKKNPGVNLMANDTISIEQLEVLNGILSKMRNVYGDTIRFSAFETTVKEYCVILGKEYDQTEASLPITNVSFGEAYLFIIELNKIINHDKTNLQFALPTKEEWEYAASGGKIENRTSYSGSTNINEVAWYQSNSGMKPHPADGQNELKPNDFDLFDMSGNVSEHIYEPYIDFNHPEQSTNMMLVKGGNYASAENECIINHDSPLDSSTPSPKVGFRLVLRVTNE